MHKQTGKNFQPLTRFPELFLERFIVVLVAYRLNMSELFSQHLVLRNCKHGKFMGNASCARVRG